ncbi:hypothetical protein [Anaerotignum sp.]
MKGITFGNLHSFNDLRLILTSKEMGSPEIKVRKIDIEGADSAIDYTDFFGEPKYSDVPHKYNFTTIVHQAEFLSLFSTVKNALHGKKMRIVLDDDPLFYYVGRLNVSSFTNEKNIGYISVYADCEPYKYKLAKTVVSKAVNGTNTVVLVNGRKRSVPTITTTTSMTIAFGEFSRAVAAGTFTIPELELVEGENTVTVTGTGTITFTWQEANL